MTFAATCLHKSSVCDAFHFREKAGIKLPTEWNFPALPYTQLNVKIKKLKIGIW